MTLTVGSLCSGYEGISQGLALVGWDIRLAWVADNDPGAARLLTHRHPEVPNLRDITAVDWAAVEPVDIITAGYPCFTSDARVLTRAGYRPISDVRIGDLVLTHRGRWRPVTALMAKHVAETVEVSAQGTAQTCCTPDHPWWTEAADWVPAKEMAGRRAVQVLPEPEPAPEELTPAVLWVLGRHLADGYVQHRADRPDGGRVTITCAHNEVGDVLTSLHQAGLRGYVSRGRTATKVAITRQWFYRLARQCGQGAGNKHVPGWLLACLDEDRAEALLSGYLSGDGCRQDSGTIHAYTATTVSKALAYSMALVAQRAYGVVCSVRLNRVAPTKVIEGRTVRQRPFLKLTVPDRNRSGRVSADRQTAYKLCRTVTAAGPAQVYNLAVEEDESYVVDNAVVHNCQPFSAAGLRKAEDDDRHIWPAIADAIRLVRPRYVLLENVRGHVGRGFARVVARLASLGYVGSWICVRASDIGAPHRRERLFCLATDAARLGHGHPWATGGERVPAAAVGGAVRPEGVALFPTPAARLADKRGMPSAETATARMYDEGRRNLEDAVALLPTPRVAATRTSKSAAIRPDSRSAPSLEQAVEISRGLLPRELAGWDEAPNSWQPMPGGNRWGQYAPAIARWEQVLGRPAPDPTEPGMRGQPRLSPRFVEWMQGLPEGWVTAVPGLSRNDQLRLLGNGVLPLQCAAALRHLATTLPRLARGAAA
jgi:DNA (cytosine-5)-methyltransferase 1